jgi:hypothetical protein|tara:strand:+ start:82 stop:516 length:435 start_codon:yes stop_codon:yes gene_type:complete
MNKIKIILAALISVANLSALTVTDVMVAVENVESNLDPYAINVKEDARGCLQIRPIFLKDYNRITKQDLPHDVVFNRSMAYHITETVWMHYAKKIPNLNAKHLVFIHNGGGSAWRYADDPNYGNAKKRSNLEIYWNKVKIHLNK